MPIKRLSQSGLLTFAKHSSMLAGNATFIPFTSDFELLDSRVLSSSAANITFSSLNTLAAGYKHLQIRAVSRDTRAISGSNNVIMTFNGDSASNYYQLHFMKGDGSNGSTGAEGAASYILPYTQPSANDTADAFAVAVIDLLDAFSSSKYTTSRSFRGVNLAAAYSTQVGLSSGLWMNTAALTEIKLQPIIGSFAAKTMIALYGVKG